MRRRVGTFIVILPSCDIMPVTTVLNEGSGIDIHLTLQKNGVQWWPHPAHIMGAAR